MKMSPRMMLVVAAALVMLNLLAGALGWDASLDALTGMGGAGVLRALVFALSWFGAVAVAPILALAGALWSLGHALTQREG